MPGKNLIIDLDPQADCSTLLSIPVQTPENTVATLFQDKRADINDLPIATFDENLFIIPSCLELDYIAITVQSKINSQKMISNHLAKLRDFDNVFLDCPPSLGCTTQNALYAATHLITPVQADPLSIAAILPIEELMEELECQDLDQKLLWTRKNAGHKKANDYMLKQKAEMVGRFFNTSIHQDQKIIDSMLRGQPVSICHPGSKSSAGYQVVAQEIQEWVG